jgi:dolichol-phosphate mannosyltransferase
LRLRETHRFLRGMVQWLGFPSAEVHYTPSPRGAGQPKYNLSRKMRLALDGVLSFSKVPLRLPLLAGLAALAVGLPICLIDLLGGAGFASAFLLGSVYLLGGSILCALGVLGEYLGRIYDDVRARPSYVLKEVSRPAGARNSTSVSSAMHPGSGSLPRTPAA